MSEEKTQKLESKDFGLKCDIKFTSRAVHDPLI